ncbi:MAG: hypothetical protein KatS3mg095_0908 [Candidatus Parcubacteria bacterium]|nr:MAG: hypothetical protein KatS3mg095_0908 [Candidatus Parcubacteria bacterium]
MTQKTIENLKREIREIKKFLGISRGIDYDIDEENYKNLEKH